MEIYTEAIEISLQNIPDIDIVVKSSTSTWPSPDHFFTSRLYVSGEKMNMKQICNEKYSAC